MKRYRAGLPLATHLAAVGPADVDDDVFRRGDFSARSLTAGQQYQRQGRARVAEISGKNGEVTIRAIVRGSRPGGYENVTTLSRLPSGAVIASGSCDCPVGYDCKHVVATILEWRRLVAFRDSEAKAEATAAPMSPALAEWLGSLADHIARTDAARAAPKKRLCFIFSESRFGRVAATPTVIDLGRDGSPKGEGKSYDPKIGANRTPPKFLSSLDLSILGAMMRMPGAYGSLSHEIELDGREGAALLADLVASEKAHWRALAGPRLRPGPSARAAPFWRLESDGTQRFSLAVDGRALAHVIRVTPLHYLDPASGEVGLLTTEIDDALISKLLAAPPVPAAHAAGVAGKLSVLMPAHGAPVPRVLPVAVRRTVGPKPVARLAMGRRPLFRHDKRAYHGWRSGAPVRPETVPALTVAFDYDGARFAPGDAAQSAQRVDGEALVEIVRKPTAEAKRLKEIAALGFSPAPAEFSYGRIPQRPSVFWLGEDAELIDYVDVVLDDAPALERMGWTVEIDEEFPLKVAEADGDGFSLELGDAGRDASGIDWFDLSLGASIGGARVDLLPSLVTVLNTLPPGREIEALTSLAEVDEEGPRRLLIRLEDGRILPLTFPEIAPIIEALLTVWGPAELADRAVLGPADVGAFRELAGRLEGRVSFVGGEKIRALAEELAAWREREPARPAPWFKGKLRPYQQTGLDWLQLLARTGFGGVLADDMGLGKTVQALAHLSAEKEAGRLGAPALVIAPTSVLGNWRSEAEKFAPGLVVHVHHGPARGGDGEDFRNCDLVVTSYPVLARDRALLTRRTWSLAVLDEAQTIRNPQTAQSAAAFAIDARQRLALTGTPVENHLGDIWSLMHFLNPSLLGDQRSFRRRYRTPIEKQGDGEARLRLARRLRPFLLRRTKEEVAPDLPEKTEIRETVELAPAQRALYEATRLTMQKRVRETLAAKGLSRSAIVVLDALLKLRQACCDPRLVRGASAKAKAGGSAKLDRLMELLAELKEEGRSALVFSQFTSMLTLIGEELMKAGRSYAWLTGETQDRTGAIEAFQSGEKDLFLISLKAGGVGLNLTRADTVILYDPWWNPAVEAQAIGRAHRIGQTRPVFVHRIIAEETIEEKMLALQERKRGVASVLFEGASDSFDALSEADVRALFE